MTLLIRCDDCYEVEKVTAYEAFQLEKYTCLSCIKKKENVKMEEKLYRVSFTHVEEIKYEGFVRASSEEEAYKMVEDEPFDIEELEDTDHQGIEVINIYVEEEEE